MATTVNFTSLTADITNFIQRGGSLVTDATVANQIPRLINAAERDCAQILKLLGQIQSLTSTPSGGGGFVQGNAIVAKPNGWRSTVSINYLTGVGATTKVQLLPRSYEACTEYWPNRTSYAAANPPKYYADYDLAHWLISPTPDQNYTFEALIYVLPTLLDASNQNNFWTDYTPNLLVYSALRQAALFLADAELVQFYQNEQQMQLATLNTQDLARILDRNAQRAAP